VAGAVSFLREASNGYRFDTDYDVRTLSGKLVAPASGGEPSFDAFVGLQDKSFGAFDFYSPGRGFASREETGTRLATAALHTGGEGRLYEARAFYREHKDEFTLDFRRPALFEANHLTRVAGAQLFGQWEGRGLLSAGLEARGESIESTTLADHRRGVASPFAEYAASVSKLDVDGALRVDYFSGFGAQASPALNLLWHLTPKSLSARAQVATAYRVPSFTELFYRDPANIGNAALKPEKSLNYGAGLVYSGAPLEASLDYFERRESEIIDWVRASTAEPWRAVNSGRVNVRGLEAQLGYLLPWGSARLDYVYVNKGLRTEAVLSKYVLDHPNHQLSLGLWRTPPREAPLWDLALFAGLTWRDYANQDYTLADISLSKRLGRFEPYLEGHNLLNASYSEALVPSPGIWGLGGVRIYFD
jgi:iron complex outermembrane receptor protein